MGNPAMVKRKNSEKRRKKYEQRLGPGVYLPKEQRLEFNAEVEKAVAAAMAEKVTRAAEKKAKKAKKEANPAAVPTAPEAAKK